MTDKANKDYNFIYFKKFDVELLQNKFKLLKDEWLQDQSRQNMQYPDRRNPHLFTNTYIVQDHDLWWNVGEKFNPILKDKEIYKMISPIILELEEYMSGKAARVLLIKLDANKNITEHTDSGDYLNAVRRFHIPIVTNEKVSYTVNNQKMHMRTGECWEINNRKPHSVDNDSNEDRIHLLIDIMPEKEFRTFKSLSKSSRIKIIENFISQEDADEFISYINNNYLDNYKFSIGKRSLEDKTYRYQANIPEDYQISDHKEMIPLIKKYSDKFLIECKDFFKDDFDLYQASFWMVRVEKGTRLPGHVDNHHGAEHLFRSGVIYLNDDYDGGHLRFFDHNLTHMPKKLSLVIFDSTYLHEVTNMVSGIRLALPLWATKNEAKCLI
jgi:hypothetical protein